MPVSGTGISIDIRGVVMFFLARRARSRGANDDFSSDLDEESELAFDAGERICPPPDDGGSSMLGASIVIALMLGAGWIVMQAPADWLGVVGERVAALSALLRDTRPAVVSAESSAIATVDASISAVPEAHVADAPPVSGEAVPDVPAVSTNAGAPVETGSIDPAAEAPPAEPLPPPKVDPADPYQKRAAAVGLHPDLSRVLLKRMTSSDYRNAGYAIENAVAKTADDGEFIWPRQRKPEEALFRVRFVRGAAPHCRRYVVTVTKDRWSTTAPPMEKCGAGDSKRG